MSGGSIVSISKINKAVEEFLLGNVPEVLSIKGGWGVGKTHFWTHFIKRRKQNNTYAFKHYAYVSLFGITTLDELKFSIFRNVVDKPFIGEPISVENLKKNTESLVKNFGRKSLPLIFGLPWLSSYGPVIESVSFSSVKDTLICLDDLERKGDSLSAKDILGLVSYLKEHRNCKVVLIFNDVNLDENAKNDYKIFREKVVDIEVEYSPTASEAADIAFANNTDVDKGLRDLSVKLDIKNIRILKKVQKAANIVAPLLRKFEIEIIAQALQTLMLFGWCYYSKDGNAPDYDYVKNTANMFSGLFRKEDKSDEQVKWDSILRNYSFTNTDDLDLSLAHVIETGYLDEEDLIEKAKIANDQIVANKSEASFSSAWSLYHDTFENNEEELVKAMRESLLENARYVSPLNMSSTVSLLRKLNKNEVADEIIDIYVQKNEDKKELFNLDRNPFSGRITDEKVIKKFNQKYSELKEIKSAEDVLENISGKNGWGRSDEEILASASEDDFYKIFKEKKGIDLNAYIETCLQFGKFSNATDQQKAISEKAINALKKIAAENKLNELRVAKYGIKIN